jgi:cytidine deaminase
MTAPDLTLSDEQTTALLATARTAATHAYVPYSHFPVGAAVLTEDGAIISGCNIENASYGLTVCAERVAIFQAVAAGHDTIRAIAVVAPRARGTTPCGACRQVINEFKAPDGLTVILEGSDGPLTLPFDAILPHAFGPRDLERDDSA